MINTEKLSKELIAAGMTTHGNCNSNGIVWDDDNKEIQNRPDVKAIIDAHNPEETPATEIVFELPIVAPDFITQTPKPEKTPKGAFDKAIAEARKGHGTKKSYGVMLMNMIEYIKDLEDRVAKLEKK